MASPVAAWVPPPPGSPALEAPSPQLVDTLLSETGWAPPCACERNIEMLAFVIVALAGMEEKSNAIRPRWMRLDPVFPQKK